MTSISRQLSVGVIGSLLLVGVIISQTANWLLDRSMRDFMAANLRDESRSMLKAIDRGPNGLILDSSRIDPAYDRPLSGRYFVAMLNGQSWRSRSLWDEQLQLPDSPGLAQELVDGPHEQRLLWLRTTYRRYGQPVTFLVATDYSPVLKDFRRIGYLLLALWIGALILLALLLRFLMRRALRSLDVARQQLEQLQTGSRIALSEEVPAELAPLVGELNRLLQHTQQLVQRSRTALGNLSHALKTPLAVLLNLTRRESIRSDQQLYDALSTQIEDMRQRITRELARARTAGMLQPDNLFDADADIPLLLESLRRAHQQKISIESHVSLHGRIPWEREDIVELLGNLLDNACKWGRQTVSLQIRRDGDSLFIQVDDDGPGIDQEKIQQALQRGERLDETVAGHGLGLAIVADKVDAYAGTIEFGRSPLGGLNVRILLPWP